jgi:hypothetical protein
MLTNGMFDLNYIHQNPFVSNGPMIWLGFIHVF